MHSLHQSRIQYFFIIIGKRVYQNLSSRKTFKVVCSIGISCWIIKELKQRFVVCWLHALCYCVYWTNLLAWSFFAHELICCAMMWTVDSVWVIWVKRWKLSSVYLSLKRGKMRENWRVIIIIQLENVHKHSELIENGLI